MKKLLFLTIFILAILILPKISLAEEYSIEITSPNGGEVYQSGDIMTVEWEENNINHFTISAAINGQAERFIASIQTIDYPTNSYSWTVPDGITYNENYQILTWAYSDTGYITNLSDGYFTMSDPENTYAAAPIMYYSYEVIPDELIEGDISVHLFDFTISASYEEINIPYGYMLEEIPRNLEMIRLGFNYNNGGRLKNLKIIDAETNEQIGETKDLIHNLHSHNNYHYGNFEPENSITFNNNDTKTFRVIGDMVFWESNNQAPNEPSVTINMRGDGFNSGALEFDPDLGTYGGVDTGSLPLNINIPLVVVEESETNGDLIVSNLQVNEYSTEHYSGHEIVATVKNIGEVDSSLVGNLRLTYGTNFSAIESCQVGSCAVGNKYNASISTRAYGKNILSPGEEYDIIFNKANYLLDEIEFNPNVNYLIKVIVDHDQDIDETNENNNTYSEEFILNSENEETVCTSWTYTDWTACINNEQHRSIISLYPENCTGGNSYISRSCEITTEPNSNNLISNVKVRKTQNSATITWNSLEADKSYLLYGTENTANGISKVSRDDDYVTNHELFLDHLLPNTTYYFRIHSRIDTSQMIESRVVAFKTERVVNPNRGLSNRLKGKLLLSVEDRGRVFYVNPGDAKKYEVTFANALYLFQRLSLGITNADLEKIPLENGDWTSTTGNRLKGKLLLQVEDRGRIWYVDMNGKRHEVTWENLMSLFTRLSLGITNNDLDQIENE